MDINCSTISSPFINRTPYCPVINLARVVDAVEWIGLMDTCISLRCALLISNLEIGSLLLTIGVASVPNRLMARGSTIKLLVHS